MQRTRIDIMHAVGKRLLPVLAGVLVLSSVLLQVADSRVSQYDSDLAERDRKIDNLLANQLQVNLMLLRWNLTESSGGKFVGMDPHLIVNDAAKSVYDDLRAQFKKGQITVQQYSYQMVEFYGSQFHHLDKLYNSEVRQYDRLKKDGTPWRWWKAAFTVLNVLLASMSMVFTLAILQLDSKRESAEQPDGAVTQKSAPSASP